MSSPGFKAMGPPYERYPISHSMMMIGIGIPISQSNPPLSIESSCKIVAWSNAAEGTRFLPVEKCAGLDARLEEAA